MPAGELTPQPETKGRWTRVVTWSAWIALVVYVIFLFFRARARQDIVASRQDITLADLLGWREWLYEGVLASAQVGFYFCLLGFLVAIGFGRCGDSRKTVGIVGRWLVAILLAAVIFVFLSLVEAGRFPGLLASLSPMVGFFFGVWVGRNALRGRRALFLLLPKTLGLLLIGIAVMVTFGFLVTDASPLPIDPMKVSSAEKRRLVDTLRDPIPLEDGTRQLCLSQHDLNLILAMGMPQVLPHARGKITLDEGTVTADLSAPVTNSEESTRYVNVRAMWNVAITAGELEVDFVQCRIGRVPVPKFILNCLLRQAIVFAHEDRDLNDVLTAIGTFRVAGDHVQAVLVSRGLIDNVMPSLLARLGQSPDVVAKTRIYYEHLAKPFKGAADEDEFSTFVQSAFALARERSKAEAPVLENRAAILALAIMLGHRRVEHLVGPVTDKELRRQTRHRMGHVKLRDRTDWCRHFLVSAALALLSNESMSDEAGLLKEELDAGDGGSGFSFADFLADRSGTLFALAATRDDSSARRMQDRLASGFDIGVIFPQAADLPEGIPDAQLESEYGGVGGQKYKAMMAEIERRLGECEGLR